VAQAVARTRKRPTVSTPIARGYGVAALSVAGIDVFVRSVIIEIPAGVSCTFYANSLVTREYA
jgi:hypothetical protein